MTDKFLRRPEIESQSLVRSQENVKMKLPFLVIAVLLVGTVVSEGEGERTVARGVIKV